MDYLRKRMTYANVMSTVAAFFAVCGTTAYVTHQIGDGTTAVVRLKANAVTGPKAKDESRPGLAGAARRGTPT
jgi:hypothetical protein